MKIKKLNNAGAIDIMFVVLLVAVLAISVFVYIRISSTDATIQDAVNDQPSETNQTIIEANDKKTESKITIDYSSWTKNADHVASAESSYKSNDASLTIFKEAPIIWYSSNAPVYCKYENNKWLQCIY